MTHEQILTEFKHRSEVLWNASKNPKTTDAVALSELKAKARAFGERNVKALEESGLTGFLMKRNCEWKNI